MPRRRPVGVSKGGSVDEHRGGEGGMQLVAADERERLGDRRVGGQHDRLARHETAGGVGAVLEERADVFGLFGLHEVEQLLGALLGQLAEEVGGVVGLHRVEDVGGALVAELLEDVHLLVLGHLLERVGEPLVGELLGDLDHALVGQVEQGVGEVGGLQVGEGRDELLGGLRLAGHLVLADVLPRRRTSSGPSRTATRSCAGGAGRAGRHPTRRAGCARSRRPR